ncbi:and other transporter-domain-containing protein [Kockovaella imperatae]|uniref:And other transporter-domain-containing protein n=1 Tax=Kockovaella imperatae TaxID=4999 RepID=A0A1Y1UJ49_9TREE|nr:and other transporter-domain-containing protein [Kockovaella imperatae]ORX37514.1 and other transporter-domain-containing protein [Kockovaella imperatae]
MSDQYNKDRDITQAEDEKDANPQHLEHEGGTLEHVLQKHLHGTGLEDRQTALELAMNADPGPNKISWRYIRLWLIVFLMCMNQGDGGFDGTLVGSINSMAQYQSYFNLGGEASTKAGVVYGIGIAGTIASFFPSYWVPDRFGRRKAMFFGNILPIIGNVLSGCAHNYPTLLAARVLGGMGFVGGAPQAYLAEISPPAWRGRIMGFYNSSYYIGQIIGTGICIPFGLSHSNMAWRIPFVLQAVPLVILMASIFTIPESPRWLYAAGRKEEAQKVLAYFHSRDNDVNSPLIQLEMQEIVAQISLDGGDKRWWDFKPLFNSRANTYRFLLGLMNMYGSQFAGNGAITNWLPALLKNAGITSTNKQRVYTFANSITSMTGAMIGTWTVDHIGRRPLMLWASGSCGVNMAIVAGLLSKINPDNPARTKAGIAFLMLHMVYFSIGWTPLQSLYPFEVISYENRQKANALRNICYIVVSAFNSFALPVILNQAPWKPYVMFLGFNVIIFTVIWIWAVETKQLSLEDLDEVFASPNPKKTSLALVREAKIMARNELAHA